VHLSHVFKTAYAVAALTGAFIIGSCGKIIPVHAAEDYALETQVAVNSKIVDQMAAGQVEINRRMDGIDTRLNEISDRVSTIQGAGAAILVVLGALQILGLIQTRQANKGAA
jgi:hypothetical protein